MNVIFEHDEENPVPADAADGMQDLMAELDEPSSTSWDIAVENPPHEGYDGPLPHPSLPKAPG
ncbi:hypothetical protein [Pararobbsia silviterrae]|uniref:Uncharacterized protein n=1 Tax=Pararobbsia silviterrae TaxID=1792498 RepID=A0A494X8P8_9BURK|nr:hypothetical protein [Pararobbsia silviterrae]RKP44756.1 hypothetical protein D7S86_27445 [Pararobbsia silviterrae]